MFKLKAALGCCLLALPYSAWALFGDSVQPYASYSISRDSNYFRVASPSQAQALLGTSDTAVTTRSVLVGVDADLKFSRQTVLLRANLNETRFDRPELQSQMGGLLNADWQWVVGNQWFGSLSYLQLREVQPQTDAVSAQTNNQDRSDLNFSANYRLYPSVLLLAGAGTSRMEFSPASREILSREESTQNLGFRLVSGAGNQIGLQIQRIDGRYVNRPAPFDRFEQSEISLQGDWRLGGHTLIHAQLGNTRRTENQIEQKTPSWRVAVDWAPSAQLAVNAFVQRQVTSSDSLTTATSSVTRVEGLSANWQLSAKIGLNAALTAETRDFSGIARRDDTQTTNLGLRYQISRGLAFGLNYQIGQRDSNQDNADYRYRQFTANLRGSF